MTRTTSNTLAILLAASFASTIGGLPFNALPILLGALSETFQLDAASAGWLGSVCFMGYLGGTLSAVVIMQRVSLIKLTVGCAFVLCSVLLLSVWLDYRWQSLIWASIGYFAALMTCLGLMVIGSLPNKEAALGTRQGIELTVTATVLFIIPAYVTYRFGYTGTTLALAAVIALLALSAAKLPARVSTSESEQQSVKAQLSLPFRAWIVLGLFLLFATGNIALWAFLERMGNTLMLSGEQQGIVFSVLKVLGGVAAFSVAVVGTRLGYRIPYWIVAVVLSLGLIMIHQAMQTGAGFWLFACGVWIWEVAFTWGCVFQTAAVARLDPANRAIMLIPTAFALSAMLGPYTGGLLISIEVSYLLLFAGGTSLVVILGYLSVVHRWQTHAANTLTRP